MIFHVIVPVGPTANLAASEQCSGDGPALDRGPR